MINVTQTFLPPLDEYVAQLQRVWDSKWLTNRGELVRELEEKLKEQLGVANLLLVNNGTIALQIAIKALELTGEIITTPFSYVATVSSIVWENCAPVFVDIDPTFWTIDAEKIEAAITERTTAILATHIYGNPCDVEAIRRIAERRNLKVIYDAAHCFGVDYKGESILNWGDVSTLSFHATKLFHTGEGGGIVCPDAELAHKIFYHHNFGHRGQEDYWGLGVNGKQSELHAALGLAILPYNNRILQHRREISELYDSRLNDLKALEKYVYREETSRNYAYYPVLLESEDALEKVLMALNEQRIFPRRYFYPSLEKLPYVAKSETFFADEISRKVLCLPLSAELETADAELVCRVIRQSL